MTKNLSLSIVIPAYNEENHLKSCLKAIEKQTIMPNEVIVVDNNSTDRTVEIAKSFPFVKVLNERKQGVLFARTKGFNAATSDVIGRIDVDTVLPDRWSEFVIDYFRDHGDIAAITGPAYWYDMPFSPVNYRGEHFFKSFVYKYVDNFPFLLGSNMAILRTAWRKVRSHLCENKEIHEDLDIAIHLHDLDMKVTYHKDMRVGLSARRFDDLPRDFFRYISLYRTSYEAHDLPLVGPRIAITAYSTGYVLLQPVRRAFDPKSKKLSLRKFMKRNPPRQQPMG